MNEPGAEQLLGQGDMLYMASGGRIVRLHGPFVKDEDISKVVSYLAARGAPTYIDDITKEEPSEDAANDPSSGNDLDPLFDQVVALVIQEKKASTSFVQRHFQIGYNRAARLMDQLEEEGVVSAPNHAGRREILAR